MWVMEHSWQTKGLVMEDSAYRHGKAYKKPAAPDFGHVRGHGGWQIQSIQLFRGRHQHLSWGARGQNLCHPQHTSDPGL